MKPKPAPKSRDIPVLRWLAGDESLEVVMDGVNEVAQPLPVVKCECLCGAVLIEGEDDGANCSACGAVVCDKCADRNYCHNDACEHSYCDKCAAGFLPAELNGDCVPCHNEWWHQHATYKRLVAVTMGPLGSTA